MLVRLLFMLLAVVISMPASVTCLSLRPQAPSDCCHRGQCPKPENVQPCLNCIAHERLAAVTTAPISPGPLGVALRFHAPYAPSGETVEPQGRLTDNSSTYLRNGVLRI
jgi:hypothetical protein